MTHGMLRETFTQNICDDLRKGFSLNVYSKPGNGLSRLVHDIANTQKAETKIIRINMKSYMDSHAGFMNDLAGQLNIPVDIEKQIETLISRWLLENNQKILLLLENFDALFAPGIDAQYDTSFVNYLNSLRNRDNIGLLLTTRKKISKEAIYFGGKLDSGSKIDLHEREELPRLRLAMQQIEAELLRRAEHNVPLQNYLKRNVAHKNLCIGAIYKHPQPYDFLSMVASKLENSNNNSKKITEFEKILTQWQKEFTRSDRAAVGVRISKWKRLVAYINFHTNELFGTYTILQKVKVKWVIIVSGIVALGFSLYRYSEKILAWFN